jgi:signal transduction histidine kinase/CheY-like chemotaxis protein
MIHIHQKLHATTPEPESIAADLFFASAFKLVLSVAAIFFLVWLTLPLSNSALLSFRYFAILMSLALATALAVAQLKRRTFAALSLWLAFLTLLVTGAVSLVPDSPFKYLFVPLPFVAVVTLGWRAGIAFQLVEVAALVFLSRQGFVPPFFSEEVVIIPILGSLLSLIAWASIDTFVNAAVLASDYSRQASQALQQARTRQVELLQAQEDLVRANQELSRLSDRLEALQQVAEQSRQAKAEFVANVSHELRAPLNMIIGFSEMIGRSPQLYGSKLPPKLLADVAIIQRNAQHLSGLVDDVLDLSQIDAHRMALSKERGSILKIVENATMSVRPLYATKGLYLETELPDVLPDVFCDVTRIQQILINLLSNAGRFTDQGGTTLKVVCAGERVIFHVADTGPGIPIESQAKLFQPFQQLDSSIRRQFGGSGLGLNISKQFVEMHGGEIWLESQVGKGTTISFSLPLQARPPLGLDSGRPGARWAGGYGLREPRDRPSLAPPPDFSPHYVVVDAGSSLKRLVERYGASASVTAMPDVPGAVDYLHKSPAQALVVNGFQWVEGVRADVLPSELYQLPYAIPAIVCWIPGREVTIRELGVVDYLIKPISREIVLEAIARRGAGALTILVVDDEPDALALIGRIIASGPHPHRVLQAQSGDRALSLMRDYRPDLIILDLVMPHLDGYQVLLEKSREEGIRDIPVIILSSVDPLLETRAANTLLVTRKDGFTVQEFMRFIELVGDVFTVTDPETR